MERTMSRLLNVHDVLQHLAVGLLDHRHRFQRGEVVEKVLRAHLLAVDGNLAAL
jgi:hypothetical protein